MSSWYPPGHGDFYDTFRSSGLLKQFIAEGREYCFLSNIDNLGATVDLNILNKLLGEDRPDKPAEFVMEVTDKTRADVKVNKWVYGMTGIWSGCVTHTHWPIQRIASWTVLHCFVRSYEYFGKEFSGDVLCISRRYYNRLIGIVAVSASGFIQLRLNFILQPNPSSKARMQLFEANWGATSSKGKQQKTRVVAELFYH